MSRLRRSLHRASIARRRASPYPNWPARRLLFGPRRRWSRGVRKSIRLGFASHHLLVTLTIMRWCAIILIASPVAPLRWLAPSRRLFLAMAPLKQRARRDLV